MQKASRSLFKINFKKKKLVKNNKKKKGKYELGNKKLIIEFGET